MILSMENTSIIILIILTIILFVKIIALSKKLKVNTNKIIHLQKSRDAALQYIEALWTNQQNLILDEKISSLSSLVVGVAHELNTPLGVALTAITYVEDSIKNKDASPMIELTKTNLHKAISLVEKFTEISGGSLTKETKPTNLKDFIEYTCCLVRSSYAVKNIRFLKKSINENLWINISESSLSIIIKNILENAFYYAYVNNILGEVEICSTAQENSLILTIKDNGCGVPSKTQKNIFDPFYTTRRSNKHYGLGLAISYNLISRNYNGTITYNSIKDEGSEFIITLPEVICNAPCKIPTV